MFQSITEIKKANEASGEHWFDLSAMRAKRSMVALGGRVFAGCYFLTRDGGDGDGRFTVHKACTDGRIETVGEPREWRYARQAVHFVNLLSDTHDPRFARWMMEVDHAVSRATGGFGVSDIADYGYRDAFDAGADPQEVAEQALAADGVFR